MHAEPYVYGRGKAAALRRAVHELLLEHAAAGALPTSNRFLFYELRQAGLVEIRARAAPQGARRGRRGSDQDLSDASKWLRDAGLVPWDWIVDETRSVSAYRYADTVEGYVLDGLELARLNCWGAVPPPLILTESRTFGGVLARALAAAYLCPVAATNGQVGGFLRTDVAPLLAGGDRAVFYVGDLDLAGGQIEENTRRVLEDTVGPLAWARLALTPAQARGLPTITKRDHRYKPHREHEAVEVEALGQREVTAVVRAALEELLPEPLEAVRAREERERDRVRARLEGAG